MLPASHGPVGVLHCVPSAVLLKPQVPFVHTLVWQAVSVPGQSAAPLHPTQLPEPLQTMPLPQTVVWEANVCTRVPLLHVSIVHGFPSSGGSLSGANPQVPETQTAFLQSPAVPGGQSAAVLHPTQAPCPLQTPVAQAVPATELTCDGTPPVQMSWVQGFESLGTSLSSAMNPQVPEAQTAFWQSPAGPCGQLADVVQLGLVQPDMS
jgi:hypothetical protein